MVREGIEEIRSFVSLRKINPTFLKFLSTAAGAGVIPTDFWIFDIWQSGVLR